MSPLPTFRRLLAGAGAPVRPSGGLGSRGPGVGIDAGGLFALRRFALDRPARHLGPTSRPGGLVGRRKGPGLEIVDTRVYASGDDIRHLDRNATARTGVPHVRLFQEERERVTVLLADFSPDMAWGTRRALRSVAAAEALAIEGWRTIEAGGKVGLLAFCVGEVVHVSPQGRERGMARVLGALARAHERALAALDGSAPPGPDASHGPVRLLEAALGTVPRGASVLLASGLDGADAAFDAAARALSARARLSCLLVLDRFEIEPPAGLYPFLAPNGARAVGRMEAGSGTNAASGERAGRLKRLGVPFAVLDAGAEPGRTLGVMEEGRDGPRRKPR